MSYQLLPPLSDDDYELLRAGIAQRGVLVPIEVDDAGTVIDGHHRKAIADELGIECPSITRIDLAEHEKRLHAVAINLERRQLTDAQRVILGKTIEPDIAEAARRRMLAGVAADPRDKCPEGQRTRDEVAAKVGLGSGRTYERKSQAVDRVEENAPDLYALMWAGVLALERADRIVRDREAEARKISEAQAEAAEHEPATVDIRLGDFRDVLDDLTDIDAIITDPPYPAEYLPLLADLAAWADKVLTDDGVLAVLMGQTHLPDVYRLLDGHRPYRWTCAYLTGGPGYVSHPRKIQSHWKPLILYGRGPRLDDVIRSEGLDAEAKSLHRWGQDYAAFHTIVERLTRAGQTIVDPFMGSGTTLLAGHALGRNVIGCDIDPAAVYTARGRLDG